jgi:D-alanyl-D-alanine carboxypeptidase/D-alanyl-D-alanine-endopeptidase (penicillin-binding protein 4)
MRAHPVASAPTPEEHAGPQVEEAAEPEDGATVIPTSALEPAAGDVRFDESAPEEFKKSYQRLAAWVREHGGKLNAALVDLESNKWLLRANEKEPVNPASNAKVLTAAAALELLGPAYQFPS